MNHKIKKPVSLLLTICICLSCLWLPNVSAETVQSEADDVTVLADLGVISVSGNEALTRAEFVSYVDEALLPEGVMTEDKLPFSDLPLDDAAYPHVFNAYTLGLIRGNGGRFYPNETISETEAIVILVRALGYEAVATAKGGWPSGYLACARTVGLLRDAENLSGDLTSNRAAALIRCALEAETLAVSGTVGSKLQYKYEGDTILYAKYGLVRSEGVLNAFGESALIREYETTMGYVNIDGAKFECSENLLPYVGYRLEYYYNETEKSIAAAYPYKNDVLVIEAEAEPKLSGRTLTYTENDRQKTVTLPKGVSVLYNGKVKTDYTADDFAVDSGTITLVDNGSGGYSTAVISHYISRIVSRVDNRAQKIIDKKEQDGGILFDENCFVSLQTEDGAAVLPGALRENDVLTVCQSEDGCVTYGYVTRKTVSGEVSTMTEEGGRSYAEISGETYRVDKTPTKTNALSRRSIGTFYLNHFGDIAWYETKAMAEDLAAVVKVGFKSTAFGSGKVLLKLLMGDGSLKEVETASSFTLDGEKMKGLTAAPTAFMPGSLIRYILNDDEELIWADTEETGAKEDSNSLTLMAPEENSYYLVGSFQGRYVPTDSTVIFKMPNLKKENHRDSDFKVGTRSTVGLNGDDIYIVKGYSFGGRFGQPDVLVIRDSASTGNIAWNSPYNLVKDVKQVYDADEDDSKWVITLVMGDEEEDCYIEESILKDNGYGSGEDYSLSAGDIVQLRKQTAGSYKEVVKLQVAWDCEKKELNPSSRIYTSGGYTGFYQERELQYGQAYWLGNEIIGMTQPSGTTNGVDADKATTSDIYYFKAYKSNIWVVDSQFKNDRKRYIRRGDFSDVKDYQHYSDCSGIIYYAMRGSLMFCVIYQ